VKVIKLSLLDKFVLEFQTFPHFCTKTANIHATAKNGKKIVLFCTQKFDGGHKTEKAKLDVIF